MCIAEYVQNTSVISVLTTETSDTETDCEVPGQPGYRVVAHLKNTHMHTYT